MTDQAQFDSNTESAAHVCFEVDRIEQVWDRLIAAGATAQGEISLVADGPMQDIKTGYLRDPGGILIELVELPPAAQ